MMFGMVLQEEVTVGEDGKEVRKQVKIKTRAGKSVKLAELLDEAKERALKNFEERKNKGKEEAKEGEDEQIMQKVQLEGKEELEKAAEVLGISSIKYYDLKQNRTQNYCFSFDQMLDPRGNTGVYLIYQYVRVCSILRKAGFDEATSNLADFNFEACNQSEKNLALTLLRLPEAIDAAAKDLMVNRLTDQLYEITNKIGSFYHDTRVLGSDNQNSSVALLLATKKVMETCFDLLGMATIDRI